MQKTSIQSILCKNSAELHLTGHCFGVLLQKKFKSYSASEANTGMNFRCTHDPKIGWYRAKHQNWTFYMFYL